MYPPVVFDNLFFTFLTIRCVAQTTLVEAPILMYLSIHPLYSSAYIIQVRIRDCQLADDLGPKFNSLDENSHDSKLL